jgi:hypothetical protein
MPGNCHGINPEAEVGWFIKFNRSTGFQALGLKYFDNEVWFGSLTIKLIG